MIGRLLAVLALVSVAATGCGVAEPIEVQVIVDTGAEQFDDLTRLDYRVYSVEDLDEVLATATNPNGSPVQAVSCDVLRTAAPDATECTETERRVTRDRQLLASGTVPADGIITVESDERIRVYASLRPDELRMDALGRVCNWNGNLVIDKGDSGAEISVRPFC